MSYLLLILAVLCVVDEYCEVGDCDVHTFYIHFSPSDTDVRTVYRAGFVMRNKLFLTFGKHPVGASECFASSFSMTSAQPTVSCHFLDSFES